MSRTQQAGNKICKLCGQDCSTRPRIKDKAGRYFCRDCYEKAIEKKRSARDAPSSPPSSSVESDDGVDWASEMLGMEAAAPAVGGGLNVCPKCNAPMAGGAVLCTQCGYNAKTGKRSAAAVAEPVGAARKATGSRTGGGVSELVTKPWFAFVAITGLFVVLSLLSRGNESMAALCGGLLGLSNLVISIVILVCAFQSGIGTGFLTLCVPFYVIYFVFVVNDNSLVKVLFGASLASSLIVYATGAVAVPSV